jgi:hypothetical protein
MAFEKRRKKWRSIFSTFRDLLRFGTPLKKLGKKCWQKGAKCGCYRPAWSSAKNWIKGSNVFMAAHFGLTQTCSKLLCFSFQGA